MSTASDARPSPRLTPANDTSPAAASNPPLAEARILLIKAKGGLGNRMLAAVTGVILAQLGDRTPVIDWRDGLYVPEGTNLYPLLFRDPIGIDPASFDDSRSVAPALWAGRLAEQPVSIIARHYPNKHSSPFIYRRLSVPLSGADPLAPVGVFWSYLPKLARLRSRLRADRRFVERNPDVITQDMLHRYFTPNDRVRQTIGHLFAGRRRPVIGVHIRFTDRKVPLAKIERALIKLRARSPASDIFLATDSAEAQNYFTARFKRVFTIDKQLVEDGKALHYAGTQMGDPVREAENAVIDMFALAACDWLIHSRHSTFSVAASLIGGIPAKRQIDVDRFNPKVIVKRWFQAFA
jgi:hypothetical protein